MPKADTQQVAKLLREYAQRTALRGGNPYRAKAYSRAADSLAALAQPLDDLIEENRLTEIPGVGDAIADIITKLHRNGTHPSLEKLRKEIPVGVLELYGGPVEFVLSASGHMAGVISAPGSKYGHWTNSSKSRHGRRMVQNCDRASEFVVASLERVAGDVLGWTSRGPDARRGPVDHRRRPGILCKDSLRRIVVQSTLWQGAVKSRSVSHLARVHWQIRRRHHRPDDLAVDGCHPAAQTRTA